MTHNYYFEQVLHNSMLLLNYVYRYDGIGHYLQW